ncbi:MAG TPA: DUF362 domain-containing protein [Spirochaetota bacterium]|nr:DUF362 domain-containing protein [Spirochaetota bacterium]
MKLTRTRFIKYAALLMAYVMVFLNIPAGTEKGYAKKTVSKKTGSGRTAVKSSSDIVSVRKCISYDLDEVYAAVKNGLEDTGFKIKQGTSVLLKPNILAQNTPDQCATTHPAVVDAVCRIFSESRCSITIGESSAFYQGGGTREGFVTSGIAAVAEKYSAALLPFEATRLRRIETGKALNPFYISGAAFSFDLVVNIPKMKVHRLARYSGAVKNNYGFIPGGTKQVYHKLFQCRSDYKEFWGIPLADVYEAVRPGLNIMDAVYGLDEDGPAASGEPKQTGLLLVSDNGAALDVVACRIMGFDPQWVPAVREVLNRGMTDAAKIRIIGEVPSIPYVKLPDEEPKTGLSKKIDDFMFDQFIVEPRLDEDECNKCGVCIQNCAVSAIKSGDEGYPGFIYDKCIYCYCCSEYCPNKAIYLHGGTVNHIIRAGRYIMKI